ncbi:hypothetical protein CIB48_g4491 [Xylaria polymorpha]|nr:hypothetical protein CIB48_g4491 [Xylaria polymorpha]
MREYATGLVPTGSEAIIKSQDSATPQASKPGLDEFYATISLLDTQSIRPLHLEASTQDTVSEDRDQSDQVGRADLIDLGQLPRAYD